MTTPPSGRWGDGLDADHLGVLAALNPRALPDALSHASCNRTHGAALSTALRGVTDPAERERIWREVTDQVHARLRSERSATPAATPATATPAAARRDQRIVRVSSWCATDLPRGATPCPVRCAPCLAVDTRTTPGR